MPRQNWTMGIRICDKTRKPTNSDEPQSPQPRRNHVPPEKTCRPNSQKKKQVLVQNLIAGCNACDRHAYSHIVSCNISSAPWQWCRNAYVRKTDARGERPPREGRARQNPKTDVPTSDPRNPNHEKDGQPAARRRKSRTPTSRRKGQTRTLRRTDQPPPEKERPISTLPTNKRTPRGKSQPTLQERRAVPH